ncbi:hypothetical protein [Fibrisoma limi]|uniref:hypothetical protein n=1 Tax=Fibrisoma limi TaxID=663275 RepID=UPI001788D91A|nr:hypothetical protein [Fibrisoma limi]
MNTLVSNTKRSLFIQPTLEILFLNAFLIYSLADLFRHFVGKVSCQQLTDSY